MSLIGFDRERVIVLRSSVRSCIDHLAAASRGEHIADPVASWATSAAAALGRNLEAHVVATIDRVLVCRSLEVGWSIGIDPLDNQSTAYAAADARELAAALSRADGLTLVDSDAEVVWLTRQLRKVAETPQALRAFQAAMNVDVWVRLCDQLGSRRLDLADRAVDDPDDIAVARQLDHIDAAFAAFGPTLAPRGIMALTTMEPYSAALIVRSLDLDASALAALCNDLLTRWLSGDAHGDRWADVWVGGENTADLLFSTLIAHPAAATAFVAAAVERPELIFRTAQYDTTVARLLETATDANRVGVADTAAMIPPLIEWLRVNENTLTPGADGVTTTAHEIVGGLIAPWLLQFGARSDEWTWTRDEADSALRWVISNDAAMTALAARSTQWLSHVSFDDLVSAESRIDESLLFDIADTAAQLQTAFRSEEVDDAARERFWFDTSASLATALASALTRGAPYASLAADAGLQAFKSKVLPHLGPPTREQAESDALDLLGTRAADTAIIMVAGVAAQLIAIGALPTDALDGLDLSHDNGDDCDLDRTQTQLHDFIDSLEDRTDAATLQALTTVMYAFTNPLATRLICE